MTGVSRLDSDAMAICRASIAECFAVNETEKGGLPDHALNYAEYMCSLEGFLDKVCIGKRELFEHFVPIRRRNGKGCLPRVLDLERQHALRMFPHYFRIARDLPRDCCYSEEVETFLKWCDPHREFMDDDLVLDFCRNFTKYPTSNEYEITSQRINAFLVGLFDALHEPKARKKILQRRRDAEESFRERKGYVDRLFQTRSRLVVLRVDFGYRKGAPADVERAVKDMQRLNENKRHNKLFRDLHGYIMKIEYGFEKGIHIHALLFFDGATRSNHSDSYLAQKIGEYWEEVIAKGDGTYWNVNGKKKVYEIRGKLGIEIGRAHV